MGQENYDVIVVGAGVIGCATTYYMAKAGLQVALLDKGCIAGEASQAGAGMLAPLEDEPSDQPQSVQQIFLTALRFYDDLDQQLKQETGIDIELINAPTLRPAFDEYGAIKLQTLQERQKHLLPDLQWHDANTARQIEPLLPTTVQGALISPAERNVQVTRLTRAYAQGAALYGAHIFEGCSVGQFLQQKQHIIGVETGRGSIHTKAVVLATGAWASSCIYQLQSLLFSL
jgi:glycine oxidase